MQCSMFCKPLRQNGIGRHGEWYIWNEDAAPCYFPRIAKGL